MNDINECPLSNNCFLSLYADGMLLYKILNNVSWNEDVNALQNDIDSLCEWVTNSYLTFRPLNGFL